MTAALVAIANANAQTVAAPSSTKNAAVDALIPWLLEEDTQLHEIPFSEVISDVTGSGYSPSTRKTKPTGES